MSDSNIPIPVAEPLASQVDRLARFILAHVPGEPSQNQGAIDTAIRIIETLQKKLARRVTRRRVRRKRDAAIREAHACGFNYAEIGRQYGITRQRIEQIVRGESR